MSKEKIKVEKEDLFNYLKLVEELKKEIELFKQQLVEKQISQSEPKVGAPKEDFAFWSAEIRFGTLAEGLNSPERVKEFRKKLEMLMREYKVAQLNATILKRL